MIDPDLKIELDQLNENLIAIKKKNAGGGVWRAFFNGMFGALGYVVGLAVVIVIVGWFLQKTGLLKPVQDQINSFVDLIDSAKKLIPSDQNSSATQSNQQGSGTPTMVTLPNGQQFQVRIQQ